MNGFASNFKKAFQRGGANGESNNSTDLVVKWGKERLSVHLPTPPSSTPLSALRDHLSTLTSLSPNSFNLIFAGGIMQDNSKPLSAYNIAPSGSVLAIVGSKGGREQIGRVERERRKVNGGAGQEEGTEQTMVEGIQDKLKDTRESMGEKVDSFESQASKITTILRDSGDYHALQKEHMVLGEVLLQQLLWLDGVQPKPEWETARNERKAGVRSVQGWLDRVDAAWKDVKAKSR